jgi:hypothetical protein
LHRKTICYATTGRKFGHASRAPRLAEHLKFDRYSHLTPSKQSDLIPNGLASSELHATCNMLSTFFANAFEGTAALELLEGFARAKAAVWSCIRSSAVTLYGPRLLYFMPRGGRNLSDCWPPGYVASSVVRSSKSQIQSSPFNTPTSLFWNLYPCRGRGIVFDNLACNGAF